MAHHKPISKARWLASQKCIAEIWHREGLPEQEFVRISRCYLPLLKQQQDFDSNTRILELFCGAVCAAKGIEQGKKTYLDPQLDAYRRAHPGKLPKGRHLSVNVEKIPEPDQGYDVILCFNGLDQALNPELFLNEIERLLATDGTLIIGLTVLPEPLVRLRYFCERFAGLLRDETHPYSYSLPAVCRALSRHFDIVEQIKIEELCVGESRFMSSEYAFVCARKKPAENRQTA
ncbi:MAG: methyltransferase domain-containing protein [Mariprofundaceae bacterium]